MKLPVLKSFACKLVLLTVFIVICTVTYTDAYASDDHSTRVIRVGYPQQTDLTEIDQEGNYSGYTYEYLRKMTQFTGWNYEFVQVDGDLNQSITTLMEMLENGEIDIIGASLKNEALAQKYEYPRESYGAACTILSALDTNPKIRAENYRLIDSLRIAVWDKSGRLIEELKNFCKDNEITYELIICESVDDQYQALMENRADVMLEVDLSRQPGTRIIERFSSRPYYFITKKGNSSLTKEIDEAITNINTIDPFFKSNLYDKYFNSKDKVLMLTKEEQEYVQSCEPIKTLIASQSAPFQYISEDNQFAGISIALLEEISEQTGIQFEFIEPVTADGLKEELSIRDIDLLVGVPFSYDFADEYELIQSQEYIKTETTLFFTRGVNIGNTGNKVLALPKGGSILADLPYKRVDYYDTIEQCIIAVNTGSADFGYGNSYSVSFYLSKDVYSAIATYPLANDEKLFCFAIPMSSDSRLIGILNKAIRTLNNTQMQAIIAENIIQPAENFSFARFIKVKPLESLTIIVLFLMLVGGSIAVIYFVRRNADKQILSLINNMQVGVMIAVLGKPIRIKYMNAGLAEMTGYMQKEWGSLVFSQPSVASALEEIIEFTREKNSFHVEFQLSRKDGTEAWLSIDGSLLKHTGTTAVIQGVFTDITDSKQFTRDLIEASKRDKMTGLYDKVSIEESISRFLDGHRKKGAAALVIIDIDYFKIFNDTYGHLLGDEVICGVAHCMHENFRKTDLLGRVGGDEFLVFMRYAGDQQFVKEKLNALLSKIHQINVCNKQVTCSMGAVVFEPIANSCNYPELFALADKTLYLAKKKRNCCEIITIEQQDKNV